MTKALLDERETRKKLRKQLTFILNRGQPEAIRRIEDLFDRLIYDPSGKIKLPAKRFRGTRG